MVDVGVGEQERSKGARVVTEAGRVPLRIVSPKEPGIDADPKISCVEDQMQASDAACCPVELQPHAERLGFGRR